MNYQEFLQTIKTEVINRFDNHFTIKIDPVAKNNGKIYDGLVINNPEINIAPTIYLNPYYHRYLSGVSISSILDDIINTYKQIVPTEDFDLTFFLDYSLAKDTVIINLINFHKNIEKLDKIPFIRYHDLVITFKCYLSDYLGETGTICITNDIMKQWGVDLETLLSDAITNTEKILPFELIDMNSFFEDHCCNYEYDASSLCMYILTNKEKRHGAVSILYPGLLEKIARDMDSDLLLIPSSIHEFLILPFHSIDAIEEYNSFINEVNSTEVPDDEILSDHVYQFSREKNTIIPHYKK